MELWNGEGVLIFARAELGLRFLQSWPPGETVLSGRERDGKTMKYDELDKVLANEIEDTGLKTGDRGAVVHV